MAFCDQDRPHLQKKKVCFILVGNKHPINMKNVIHPMPPTEQLRANTAIKKIQKWIEERYPKLTAVSKTKLIIECLIELTEEKSFLAANN